MRDKRKFNCRQVCCAVCLVEVEMEIEKVVEKAAALRCTDERVV